MTIEFQCDGCLKTLRTADDKAGERARCPQCGQELTVPVAPPTDFLDVPNPAVPAPKSSHLSDFEELTRAAPRPRPQPKPVEISCPMCGEVNDGTTDRCLACGEPLEQFPAEYHGNLSTAFTDVWSRAWELWTTNLGINVAATAIGGGLLTALGFGLGMIIMAVMFGGFAFQPAAIPQPGAGQMLTMLTATELAVNFVYYIFTGLFVFSMAQFSLHNVRRENPQLGAMVPPGSRTGSILGGMLLYGILLWLTNLPAFAFVTFGLQTMDVDTEFAFFNAFLIPMAGGGISAIVKAILVAFLWPAPYLLMDRRVGPVQSLLDAPAMALRFFKLSVLMALVQAGLNMLGAAACSIGLLFSIPLSFMLLAVAYERCHLVMDRPTEPSNSLAAN